MQLFKSIPFALGLVATSSLVACSNNVDAASQDTSASSIEKSSIEKAAQDIVDQQKVSPKLADFQKQYVPQLIETSPRVHAVSGYEYSTYGYIEGDDGVIVVDTGWFPGQAKRSIADYRKITDKPVVAIIYTHLHLDHYGGATGIMEGEATDIPVYGPVGWQKWVTESFTNLRPEMFKRIYMQMGLLLPQGENGTVGSGVGPAPKAEGSPEFAFRPNVEIGEYTELNISGVNIHLIPTPGDLNEHLYVWLPDDKVLFVGDVLAGTFPAVETVRFEAGRDPLAQVAAYQRAIDLAPDYIIGGHGRVLMGADDARDVMEVNRDATQFLVDQLDRLYLKGLSADDVIDQLKLPPAIANHPDMQFHYHRLEWMLKTMHLKRAGFIGSSIDYVTLTEHEEAKRLVKLMGGMDNVRAAAQKALADDDPRWAARLATYVLEIDEGDAEAIKIRQNAFLRVARTTESANERNYLLTIIKEENGEINWTKLFSANDLQVISGLDAKTILNLMKVRFRAEAADGIKFSVRLNIDSEGEPFFFTVRNNVLFLSEKEPATVDAVIDLPRATLNQIAANYTNWSDAMANSEMTVASGGDIARQLASLIE